MRARLAVRLGLVSGLILLSLGWWLAAAAETSLSPPVELVPAPAVMSASGVAENTVPVSRHEVMADEDPQLPRLPAVPGDALRVEVTVVDHLTEQPLPGVELQWSDTRSRELLEQVPAVLRQQVAARSLLAWRGRTDARGRLTVHLCDHTTVMLHEDRWSGELHLHRDLIPPAGFVLRAFAGNRLQVLVRDANGRSAPGVDLSLSIEAPQHVSSTGLHAVTDADGRAEFAPPWRLHEERAAAGVHAGELQWIVRARIVGPDAPHRSFDPKVAAPSVELQLPACGVVVSRFVAAGEQMPVAFRLQAAGPRSSRNHHVLRRDSGAVVPAVFPWVQLGIELELESLDLGVVQRLAPLRGEGERREVTVTAADAVPVLRFRLVDAQRRPLVATEFACRLPGRSELAATTDAGGWFQGACRGTSSTTMELEVRVGRTAATLRYGARRGLVLTPGVNQLGDLVVDELPVLAGGRFVSGGQPLRGIPAPSVEHCARDADAVNAANWRRVDPSFGEVDGDRFVVRGRLEPGRHRLVPADSEWLQRPPVEFAAGATDLLLEVTPTHALAASVRVDLHDASGLSVVLQPQDAPGGSPRPRTTKVNQLVGGRDELWWSGLAAGTYSLEVRLLHFAEGVLRIDDLQVPPPYPPDPRLAIDLRGLVEELVVQVTVDGARAVVNDDDLLVLMATGSPVPVVLPFWADEVRLAVPKRPTDLLIAFAGCAPLRLPAARGTVRATVVPYPQVDLRLVEPLPEGFGLRVQLQPTGAGITYQFKGRRHTIDLGGPSLQPQQMVDGRLRLPVGAQPQRLLVQLVRDDLGKSVTLHRCEPPTLQAGTTEVALRLDADEVRAAIAAAR